jgi:putative membrane protein
VAYFFSPASLGLILKLKGRLNVISYLPHLQAILNAVSLVLICLAYLAIKSGNKELHKKLMISALGVSAVFLVSYLTYHANVGHVPFAGEGVVRTFYFTLLFTHIGCAAIALVLIIMTVFRAWKGMFERHKAIARWTFPIWAFVCASGIVVYVMAFHIYVGLNA